MIALDAEPFEKFREALKPTNVINRKLVRLLRLSEEFLNHMNHL